jgi:hypothetical protein
MACVGWRIGIASMLFTKITSKAILGENARCPAAILNPKVCIQLA